MSDTNDIHSDGSVELIQRWLPGGAQGNKYQLFEDGEQYLFAVRLSGDTWEFHSVVANSDLELGCDFRTPGGDSWCDWTWSDVEWFIPCRKLDLPFIAQKGPSE